RKQRVLFKSRRNHREHGFFGRETFEEAKLETVLNTGGIAGVLREEMEPPADGEARTRFSGFGTEPAAIGNDGVDFTVVGNVAEGLREMPGGLRVGGIALVKNGKSGSERVVAQVFVELRELPGRKETFVDDSLRRERADVTARRKERFGALSEERETPLEAGGTARGVECLDEELPDFRHGFEG